MHRAPESGGTSGSARPTPAPALWERFGAGVGAAR